MQEERILEQTLGISLPDGSVVEKVDRYSGAGDVTILLRVKLAASEWEGPPAEFVSFNPADFARFGATTSWWPKNAGQVEQAWQGPWATLGLAPAELGGEPMLYLDLNPRKHSQARSALGELGRRR